jgi:hypothetical protein
MKNFNESSQTEARIDPGAPNHCSSAYTNRIVKSAQNKSAIEPLLHQYHLKT